MQPALLAKEIIHTGKAHRLVTVDSTHPQVHVLTGSVEGFSQHTTQVFHLLKVSTVGREEWQVQILEDAGCLSLAQEKIDSVRGSTLIETLPPGQAP